MPGMVIERQPKNKSVALGPHAFGLRHVFLFTTMLAIYCAWLLFLYDGRVMTFNKISLAASSMISAVALSGAFILINQYRRGRALPEHPGENLLLAMGAIQLFVMILSVPSTFIAPQDDWSRWHDLAAIVVVGAILVRMRSQDYWDWLFVFILASCLWRIVGKQVGWGMTYADFVNISKLLDATALLGGLAFVALDLRTGRRRSWLHWTGVATYAANIGGALAGVI
jgi:hypothetical protein